MRGPSTRKGCLVLGVIVLLVVASAPLVHATSSSTNRNEYGWVLWPAATVRTPQDMAALGTQFFPHDRPLVVNQTTKQIRYSRVSSTEVRVAIVRDDGSTSAFDQRIGPGFKVDPGWLHPVIMTTPSVGGRGWELGLLGPPGSIILNGSTDEEKAQNLVNDLGYPAMQISWPHHATGYEVLGGCMVAPDGSCGVNGSAIALACRNCTEIDVWTSSNTSAWWNMRFNRSLPPRDFGGGGGGALVFDDGQLVYGWLSADTQLNVSAMMNPAAASERVLGYLSNQGYGVDPLEMNETTNPTGGVTGWLSVERIGLSHLVYSWPTVHLFNLSEEQRLLGNETPLSVQPWHFLLNGNDMGSLPKGVQKLYIDTNLQATIQQDAVTGQVLNMTLSSWYESPQYATVGGSPGFHIPTVGLPGVVGALAVVLALARRRRGG